MKKTICIFLLLITTVLTCFSGCGRDETDIYAVMGELCAYFDSSGETYAKYVLMTDDDGTAEKLGRLYTGLYEAPGCYPLINGYAVRLPSDESGFEIHAVRCRNRSDTAEIADLLLKRIKKISFSEIKDYAPESFEMYFAGSEIFVLRDTVYLLATPDNAAAKRIIRKVAFY
ncbi:MAG: hypothetical protein E7634_02665 [Ruminococcaceae bacterium]|nr:hypothetical protein [Oscillospiraceae bacterium]